MKRQIIDGNLVRLAVLVVVHLGLFCFWNGVIIGVIGDGSPPAPGYIGWHAILFKVAKPFFYVFWLGSNFLLFYAWFFHKTRRPNLAYVCNFLWFCFPLYVCLFWRVASPFILFCILVRFIFEPDREKG